MVPEVPGLQPLHCHQGIQEAPETQPGQDYPVEENQRLQSMHRLRTENVHLVLLGQQIQGCQVNQGFPAREEWNRVIK